MFKPQRLQLKQYTSTYYFSSGCCGPKTCYLCCYRFTVYSFIAAAATTQQVKPIDRRFGVLIPGTSLKCPWATRLIPNLFITVNLGPYMDASALVYERQNAKAHCKILWIMAPNDPILRVFKSETTCSASARIHSADMLFSMTLKPT